MGWRAAGRVLLNLDTEDWGEIFIGCAGGGDSMLTLPVTLEAAPDAGSHQAFDLSVSGAPPASPIETAPHAHAVPFGLGNPQCRLAPGLLSVWFGCDPVVVPHAGASCLSGLSLGLDSPWVPASLS